MGVRVVMRAFERKFRRPISDIPAKGRAKHVERSISEMTPRDLSNDALLEHPHRHRSKGRGNSFEHPCDTKHAYVVLNLLLKSAPPTAGEQRCDP